MLSNLDKAGIIDDVFSEEEVKKFETFFYKLKDPVIYNSKSLFYSLDTKHPLHKWFQNNIFYKIQEIFGEDVKLMFGSLLHSLEAFTVHSDYYHKDHREPYKAFIIPLCSYSNTIIFNEEDDYTCPDEVKTSNPNLEQMILNMPVKENNALQYKNQYLSHHSDEILSRLTVRNILKWKLGSLLYWDEKLLHCSDNYFTNNYDHKKGLVIHTYKEEK